MVGVGNTKKRAKISLIGCGGDENIYGGANSSYVNGTYNDHQHISTDRPCPLHEWYLHVLCVLLCVLSFTAVVIWARGVWKRWSSFHKLKTMQEYILVCGYVRSNSLPCGKGWCEGGDDIRDHLYQDSKSCPRPEWDRTVYHEGAQHVIIRPRSWRHTNLGRCQLRERYLNLSRTND